jgi:cytochrome c biogenesis factor
MECGLPSKRSGRSWHLEIKHRVLLGKWLLKLLTENGIWQTLLRRKYVGSNAFSRIYWKPGVSHFWVGIIVMKKGFFPYGSFCIRDG